MNLLEKWRQRVDVDPVLPSLVESQNVVQFRWIVRSHIDIESWPLPQDRIDGQVVMALALKSKDLMRG